MPTVLTEGPYRFFFYAGDRNEPPHIHIQRDDAEAKFWLTPVHLENSFGLNRKEINRVQSLVENYRELFLERWYEFFSH